MYFIDSSLNTNPKSHNKNRVDVNVSLLYWWKMDATKNEVENEEAQEDVFDDPELLQDDPELLAMKKEFDAIKEKEKLHKRENTADMSSRLNLEIEQIATKKTVTETLDIELNLPEHTEILTSDNEANSAENAPIISVESLDIDNEEEVKAEINNSTNTSPEYKNEVKSLWNIYVENAKNEKEKVEEVAAETILLNPFLQKMLRSEPSKWQTIEWPPRFLLYDMLMQSYTLHCSIVSDYTIRKLLLEHESFTTNNKY